MYELDCRPLCFAFIQAHFETYVLRDLGTGEILEISLDIDSGKLINPVELTALNRQIGIVEGRKLGAGLLNLVLRHPELENIRVILKIPQEGITSGWDGDVDLLNPDFHRYVDLRLGLEFRLPEEGFIASLHNHFLILECILTVAQIIRLGGNLLIQSIELSDEPMIKDD